MAEKGNFDFIYNPILEKMRELVTPINYSTYIEKLVPVDIDGRFIILETPTELFAKYITGVLADKMREAIIKADVGISDFRLVVEGSEGYSYNAPTEEKFEQPSNLNPKYTFENFVVGKNNDFGCRGPGGNIQSTVHIRRNGSWQDALNSGYRK